MYALYAYVYIIYIMICRYVYITLFQKALDAQLVAQVTKAHQDIMRPRPPQRLPHLAQLQPLDKSLQLPETTAQNAQESVW